MSGFGAWHPVPGVRGCNCYAWIGRTVTVIDTGLPGNEHAIQEFIKTVAPGKRITVIALTHSDIDHVGSAVGLKALTGAKIAMHAQDADAVEGKRALKEMHPLLSWPLQAISLILGYRPFKPDIVLHEGDRIEGLQVVHVPGHSRGSIALYRPGKLVFTGDAVMTNHTGAFRRVRSFLTQSMRKTQESTRKIARLRFRILCPGHGPVLRQDASSRFRRLFGRSGRRCL